MRIIIFLFFFLVLTSTNSSAATLYRVRFGYYPEKIRIVFDFNLPFDYQATTESAQKIIIHFPFADASADIQNYTEINDLIIQYLAVEKNDADLKVSIPLAEPIKYTISALNQPPRLVIDFDRQYLNISAGGLVANGQELLKAEKVISAGRIKASVLRLDLKKVEIRPALAKRSEPNLIESMVEAFTPWVPKPRPGQFVIDKVSNIVASEGGISGVNGTYFASNGKPLGALMINQELLTFSIHDRTAFFLDQTGQPYIDNIFITSHFRTYYGHRFDITGINQSRDANDIIMYTPIWGDKTGTPKDGLEFVVCNSQIKAINTGNTAIPDDGFVLSVAGPAVETLSAQLKVGDQLETKIKVVPYSCAPQKIIHLISGGPRLVKQGTIYISKNEEKFRSDIANGRAARTAIGITKQGEILLVTVDGLSRKNHKTSRDKSIGLTLEELSALMISLGAVDAMNLDGGSSSTMVVNNDVINSPVTGYQRGVSNAIVVSQRESTP
jgi:hypothetical protein